MQVAFTDANGGYYQTEVEQEGDVPLWAVGMTPCPVQVPTVDPKDAIRAEISGLLTAKGVSQKWQIESAAASVLALAVAQGLTEPEAYAQRPGYRDAKDLLIQIAALEARL